MFTSEPITGNGFWATLIALDQLGSDPESHRTGVDTCTVIRGSEEWQMDKYCYILMHFVLFVKQNYLEIDLY